MSQIALAWQWMKGISSPIIGATKTVYLDDAVIMNLHDCNYYSKNYQFNRMLLRIKYDVPQLDEQYLCERDNFKRHSKIAN